MAGVANRVGVMCAAIILLAAAPRSEADSIQTVAPMQITPKWLGFEINGNKGSPTSTRVISGAPVHTNTNVLAYKSDVSILNSEASMEATFNGFGVDGAASASKS